jgi:hypothetical protein
MKGESKSEFDAECNKVMANAEAERPGKSIYLRVKVRDLRTVELVDHAGELSMRDLQIRLRPEWNTLIFANSRTTRRVAQAVLKFEKKKISSAYITRARYGPLGLRF